MGYYPPALINHRARYQTLGAAPTPQSPVKCSFRLASPTLLSHSSRETKALVYISPSFPLPLDWPRCCSVWHALHPPLGNCNNLSFQCQLSPDLSASLYLNNNQTYILTFCLLLSGKNGKAWQHSVGEAVGKQVLSRRGAGNAPWLDIYGGKFGNIYQNYLCSYFFDPPVF